MKIYGKAHNKIPFYLKDDFLERERGRPKSDDWRFDKAFKIYQKSGTTVAIDILDEISFWGINAKDIRDQLKGIQASHIEVTINSPGGDVFDGFAIYNELANHPAEVTTIITGEAASVASIIAKAGDHRVIFKNSKDMIHNPWVIAFGESKDLRKMADLLDALKEDAVMIYSEASTLTAPQIAKFMDDETWFNADEALKNGFVHEVIDPKKSSSDAPSTSEPSSSRDTGADEELNKQYEIRQREIDFLEAL